MTPYAYPMHKHGHAHYTSSNVRASEAQQSLMVKPPLCKVAYDGCARMHTRTTTALHDDLLLQTGLLASVTEDHDVASW